MKHCYCGREEKKRGAQAGIVSLDGTARIGTGETEVASERERE